MLIIPVAGLVSVGIGWAYYRKKVQKRGALTPEREAEFNHVMNKVLDVAQLQQAAERFEGYGLKTHAKTLRQRIELRNAPPELKERRNALMQAALASKDLAKVNKTIAYFESIGAVGCVDQLKKAAAGLT